MKYLIFLSKKNYLGSQNPINSLKYFSTKRTHWLTCQMLKTEGTKRTTQNMQLWTAKKGGQLYICVCSRAQLHVYVCARVLSYIYMCVLVCSVVSDSATPWTVAHQAPPSAEFFRQEFWSGLPFPPPGDLPGPGIKPVTLSSPALASRFFTTTPPGKPCIYMQMP